MYSPSILSACPPVKSSSLFDIDAEEGSMDCSDLYTVDRKSRIARGSVAVHGSLAGVEVWLLYTVFKNRPYLKITLDLSSVCFENKGFKNCDL